MRILFTTLSLLIASSALADDDAKSKTLPPKEIADGWLLLFDGASTFGWKIVGEAKVADGALILGGDKETTAMSTTEFCDCQVRVSFIMARHRTADLQFGADTEKLEGGVAQGVYDLTLKNNSITTVEKRWGLLGESKTLFEKFPQSQSRTPIVLRVPAGTSLTLQEMKLKPLGLKPLFNGKDLTGWKEAPNKKSKCTVTDTGTPGATLNIQDGPGDLQTEGQWDDFVLQLECISHGKHLNSGVFFRCIPGQYQNGYEAQIHNGCQDHARTQPLDFGTGAIYRRVAARKVVSRDMEWFTMTVIAHGRHLATWVNGYQTVDWTDERPPDDNPRKGSKTGKGAISLQGHDPTTNLSFRNLRITELPKARGKK